MTPNINQPASQHNKNFETYLTEYARTNALTMRGSVWKSALAAAQRLDNTQDTSAAPNMALIPKPQATFMGRLLALLPVRRRWEELSELEHIHAFLRLAPDAAAQQSEIKWGPLRNGFGTWMKAILRPGGQQEGSRPTPAIFIGAGWEMLNQRKLLNGTTLYVRGHLLHHLLGGVGLFYNLVALTAAVRGDFGANQANLAHRHLVEGPLLWAYLNMHGVFGTPTITEIYYDVVADYKRSPRKGTEELAEIIKAYQQMGEEASTRAVAEGLSHPITHLDLMVKLALNSPSPHLDDAFVAIAAKPGEDWKKVHQRMVQNQQLWAFEDQNVPRALNITYSWVENGMTTQPRHVTVDIHLPNSLAARFIPR